MGVVVVVVGHGWIVPGSAERHPRTGWEVPVSASHGQGVGTQLPWKPNGTRTGQVHAGDRAAAEVVGGVDDELAAVGGRRRRGSGASRRPRPRRRGGGHDHSPAGAARRRGRAASSCRSCRRAQELAADGVSGVAVELDGGAVAEAVAPADEALVDAGELGDRSSSSSSRTVPPAVSTVQRHSAARCRRGPWRSASNMRSQRTTSMTDGRRRRRRRSAGGTRSRARPRSTARRRRRPGGTRPMRAG